MPYPLSCLILADDFTGSCDTGMQFVQAGLSARVVLGRSAGAVTDADVLVWDTETRNAAAPEARARMEAACRHLGEVQARVWYKKIDSTLRGAFAAELPVLMAARGFDLCLVAPAFPEAGRTTVGGYHLLHGVPVARTPMGADPGAPVRHSYVPRLFADEEVEVRLVGLATVERGADAILDAVQRPGEAERVVVVLDAASPRDLSSVALAAARLDHPALLCGSAGLAAHLPGAFGLKGRSPEGSPGLQPEPVQRGPAGGKPPGQRPAAARPVREDGSPDTPQPASPSRAAAGWGPASSQPSLLSPPGREGDPETQPPASAAGAHAAGPLESRQPAASEAYKRQSDAGHRREGPVLVLAGSTQDLTRRQLDRARTEPGLRVWSMPRVADQVDEIRAALRCGESVALSAGDPEGVEGVARAVGSIVRIGRSLIEALPLAGLVVTGGWTAVQLLEAVGGEGVEILDRVDEGVPLCRLSGGPLAGLPIVTKAGALGGEGAIVDAINRLRGSDAG